MIRKQKVIRKRTWEYSWAAVLYIDNHQFLFTLYSSYLFASLSSTRLGTPIK